MSELLQSASCDSLAVGQRVVDYMGEENVVADVGGSKCVVVSHASSTGVVVTPSLSSMVFLSREHYLRHKEASALADYIADKLEWGVIPKGVTLEDLQRFKSIIDKGECDDR